MRVVLLGLVTLAALILFTSSGAQTLIRTQQTPNPQSDGHSAEKVAIADVNGDRKADSEDVGGNQDPGRVYVSCVSSVDSDCDGYWDGDETLKGSVVLNASSTPEHCDGVDNDGDTAIDEAPTGGNWNIDSDVVKDCLDASVDTDGDGLVNTLDADDDGDGRTDAQERKLSTDELGACSTGMSHDGWAQDRDRDRDADVGDVIQVFGMGKIIPANYDARSDPDMDGDVDVGDVIQLYGTGKIGTNCVSLAYTNNTGGPVDDVHIEWSAPIAEVLVARDSAPAGWSSRVISGGGTVLNMERPDGSGDLAAGGTLTVVVVRIASTMASVTACRWTLEGVDVGACVGGGDPVLVGAGDIASCGSDGDEATSALLDAISGTVITIGDNVYPSGTAEEFASCFEPSWGRHKTRIRPSPGNHDYETPGAAGYFGYFGEAAGDPSTGYYSYDLGGWHVVVLNSNCSQVGGCGAGSPQEQWLRADLAAQPAVCALAYWHHPRFSSGLHGSSTSRQPLWQALYDYGADVVVNGHDHSYERFALQDPDGVADASQGIREFVVGTGGANLYSVGTPIANSEVLDNSTFGVLKLTLHPNSYEWEFMAVPGSTFSDSGSQSCH